MMYTITITNNIHDGRMLNITDISTISSCSLTDPDITYIEHIGDIACDESYVSVPMYKKFQFVKLPPSNVLIIQTEDSDEAMYYCGLSLDNASILCDPDPVGGESADIVSALKDLYIGLGGSPESVESIYSIAGVISSISTMYGGNESYSIPQSIENVSEVANNIGSSGPTFSKVKVETDNYCYTMLNDKSGIYDISGKGKLNSSTYQFLFGATNEINGFGGLDTQDMYMYIVFTPGEGFTKPTDLEFIEEDTVEPGDGKLYYISMHDNGYYTLKKTEYNYLEYTFTISDDTRIYQWNSIKPDGTFVSIVDNKCKVVGTDMSWDRSLMSPPNTSDKSMVVFLNPVDNFRNMDSKVLLIIVTSYNFSWKPTWYSESLDPPNLGLGVSYEISAGMYSTNEATSLGQLTYTIE